MPSGAKKRKAAKKKKELEATVSPATDTSQGNEDAKSQDDKGSDSGEIDSPASQNHQNHNHPFSEENKEILESCSSMAAVPDNVVSTQKAEDASERNNGGIQNECVEGSHEDSHISVRADDESINSMKKPEVPAGETMDSPVATASIIYSVTPEISASEETISVAESAAVETTAIRDMIVSEKLEKHSPTTVRVTFVPLVDIPSKQNGDGVSYLSGESVNGSTGGLESASEKYGQKASLLDVGVSETSNSASQVNSKSESEDQPLIPSGPRVAQRTSWLSCCGLCDVLTGSNR